VQGNPGQRWHAFVAVGHALRAGLLGGSPTQSGELPWPLLIEASSYHYVTPALAWCLRAQPQLPDDIRGYLDAVLTLNRQRNDVQSVRLPRERQIMLTVDHRFALSNPALVSAPSKKSFSSVSSPNLACSAFTSTAGCVGVLPPGPNTLAADSCNWVSTA